MTRRKFEVITITSNLDKYPQYKADTQDYQALLSELKEEVQTFVICNQETGFQYYIASDFFDATNIKTFLEVEANE
jgi:hypothetical protein